MNIPRDYISAVQTWVFSQHGDSWHMTHPQASKVLPVALVPPNMVLSAGHVQTLSPWSQIFQDFCRRKCWEPPKNLSTILILIKHVFPEALIPSCSWLNPPLKWPLNLGGSPENSGGFGLAMDYHEEQIHEVVLKLPQAAVKRSK